MPSEKFQFNFSREATPDDRRPYVVSETSPEYQEFRHTNEFYREQVSSVFGETELNAIGSQRDLRNTNLDRIQSGELVAFLKTKEEHLEEMRQYYERVSEELFKGYKEKVRTLLRSPTHSWNAISLFQESLENPAFQFHIQNSIQEAEFVTQFESAVMFLRGEIPTSITDRLWERMYMKQVNPLYTAHFKVCDEMAVRIQEACDRGANDEAEKIREELRNFAKPDFAALRQKEAEIRKDFYEGIHALKDRYAKKYAGYEMPDDLFESMLQIHIKEFKETATVFEKEAETWKDKFKATMLGQIERGELHLDPELVERRISEMKVMLWDPVLHGEGRLGDFDPNSGLITIRADRSPQEREKIFAHEMFHALSGRIIVSEVRGGRRRIYFRKLGLSFQKTVSIRPKEPEPVFNTNMGAEQLYPIKGTRELGGSKGTLMWLNEALTEYKALEYMGMKDSSAYTEFRNLLEIMKQQGVDMKLMDAAYYENDDPNMSPEKRKSAWKAFSENLAAVYPGGEGDAISRRGVRILRAVELEPDVLKQRGILQRNPRTKEESS